MSDVPVVNPPNPRILSVDALRGLIMIVMALDHVRDYVSAAAMSFNPTDLSRTTAALFFTRWITHFCAPVFAFTAGIGAFFFEQNGRTKSQLSRFLLSRGLWLVFLEVTVVRFLWLFQVRLHGSIVPLLVFWMLGLSMIFLAALVHLPVRILAPLSLFVIAAHNLLDPIDPARFGRAAFLWDVFHQPAGFPFHGGFAFIAYPLIPWIFVMSAGYCFGNVLRWDPLRRRKFQVAVGVACTIAFLILRAWNHYGDSALWSHQKSALFTMLSFLNVTKYPPSLLFLLMTVGPALIALAFLEKFHFSSANPLIVFGRVPFFYFLFHIAAAHLVSIGLGALRYGPRAFLLGPPPTLGGSSDLFPPDYGFSLPIVYLVWVAVVVIAYPLCRWYASLKQRRRDLWWLSYL
ncbi:MAG TPA: heparan-alpha-glucosaminide N-acetyltransferase domain-containing protein [Candidatus Acidoferrum sp.]|nr:heparan-alpha-glucosaminide N-acetyltransferase domain-containing protein [Candidatus Acidoferrum sp.]